jgi:hypothetical protein
MTDARLNSFSVPGLHVLRSTGCFLKLTLARLLSKISDMPPGNRRILHHCIGYPDERRLLIAAHRFG